ncbi:7_t:CDS:2 [Gigaspora rosea]|nr:7_t:CDS:2 [Gigaspora rosea]
MSVWAIGTYPMDRDDNEIELIIYIPVNSIERDPETQAFFKREEYYSIEEKIFLHFMMESRDQSLLTGTLQDMPTEINNTDGIIKIIMTDYVNGQEHDYMFKIVFPHNNSRFSHLKTNI